MASIAYLYAGLGCVNIVEPHSLGYEPTTINSDNFNACPFYTGSTKERLTSMFSRCGLIYAYGYPPCIRSSTD